jgi:long-chain acyl-CoA synthetase
MAPASAYDERPWTALYDPGLPGEIEAHHPDALTMFRAAVERAADRPAIHYFDRTITYGELDELSDALAAALADLGLARGDRCAAYLQNVPQFPTLMLACWKAGAIMVSVNPMLRHKEVRALLNDSGSVALVTLESLWRDVAREVVPDTEVRQVVTTSELEFLDENALPPLLAGSRRDRDAATHDLLELVERFRGQKPPEHEFAPDDVAFLTYTSGTTGPPKGAMNTHRAVTFNADTFREWFHLDESDVILGVAPLFHITGLVASMATAFRLGIPLILGYRFDVRTVLGLVEQHGATTTVASITVFIAFMNEASEDCDLSTLRKAYSGGAPIAPATVEAYEERFGVYVHPIYGLTETTSPSHAVPLGARAPIDPTSGALSVGVPTFNVLSRVVDEDGREIKPGEVGEIVIEGPQVVPGYWEQPEETEHAFPGGVLHTGDVGFMDDDGWFYIVDRKKDQINASGYKVWPREVEDVLYSHPAVLEAAVVGAPDPYRGETVRAYVSLKAGRSAEEAELIAFCREHMAAYKYPRSIEFLDELPKTASGKILRRDLRDRARARTA